MNAAVKGESLRYYKSRGMACRMTAKRSRDAYAKGQYSQFEVRTFAGGYFVCGWPHEMNKYFKELRIVAQYSGGYSC